MLMRGKLDSHPGTNFQWFAFAFSGSRLIKVGAHTSTQFTYCCSAEICETQKKIPESKKCRNTVTIWVNPGTDINRTSISQICSATRLFFLTLLRQVLQLPMQFATYIVFFLSFFIPSPVFPPSLPSFHWCRDVWKKHKALPDPPLGLTWRCKSMVASALTCPLTWWFVICDGLGSTSDAFHSSINEDGDLHKKDEMASGVMVLSAWV